jgi:hypothetical protein
VVINDAPGLSRETAKEEHMSKRLRVVLATDEDLLRDFGEAKLLIGLPVRPTITTPPAPSEVRGANSAGGEIGPGSRRRSRIEGPEEPAQDA